MYASSTMEGPEVLERHAHMPALGSIIADGGVMAPEVAARIRKANAICVKLYRGYFRRRHTRRRTRIKLFRSFFVPHPLFVWV